MRYLLFFASLLWLGAARAQVRDGEIFQQQYRLPIERLQGSIKIDGELSEPVWQTSRVADSFWLKFPNDVGRPVRRTQVYTSFDDKNIYFAFVAYDSGKSFAQSLRRDIGHDANDCVGIILDPTNQRTNGFFFVLSAFNAQSEDQLPLNENSMWSWDNKWLSAVKHYPDRWTAEISIPYKTLRYTPGKTMWGINFLRVDTKANEYSTWTNVPVNFPSHTLGYTGALVWAETPPPAGSNSVFIPYITGSSTQDNLNGKGLSGSANVGFDGKLALNSSLNLDVTVNPDFSQIEVDQQVTNLTRFNIFFPERRTFFLENADIFSEYGTDIARPFYSRRIGLDNEGNRIPILGGLRLTGNIDKSTRIGLMNMQTAKTNTTASQNYTAATVSKRVMKRSTINAFFLNRQSFMTDSAKNKQPLDQFGRNAGIEFNYRNLQGTWGAWAGYYHSFKPGISNNNKHVNTGFEYNGRNFRGIFNTGNMGSQYYADMGFLGRIENYDAIKDTVVRLGYTDMYNELGYRWYPAKGKVNMHDVELNNYSIFNPNGTLNETTTELNYFLQFRNTGSIFANVNANQVNLLFPTAFTNEKPLLPDNYYFNRLRVGFNSDFRKRFSFGINGSTGGFYNGTMHALRGSINLRKLPYLNVGINAEYNKVTLAEGYGNTELILLSSRVEVTFTTAVFWTTFVQYNTQRNNFNINSRLQYRFKPMSDLFVVYTDNYFTDPLLKSKSRALVFKLNYWLNL
jgi:hypothetical protein